jgi:hypothetical protein
MTASEWSATVFASTGRPIAALWAERRRPIAERARELDGVQVYARRPDGDRECWTRDEDGAWQCVRRVKVSDESAAALETGGAST